MSDGASRIVCGSLFQAIGPAMMKACSANVVLCFGMIVLCFGMYSWHVLQRPKIIHIADRQISDRYQTSLGQYISETKDCTTDTKDYTYIRQEVGNVSRRSKTVQISARQWHFTIDTKEYVTDKQWAIDLLVLILAIVRKTRIDLWYLSLLREFGQWWQFEWDSKDSFIKMRVGVE